MNAHRPIATRLRISPDGRVSRPGIETPFETKVIARNAGTITIKVPGHHYWSGRGMPASYAPMEYQVYKIVGGDDSNLHVEGLIEFGAAGARA